MALFGINSGFTEMYILILLPMTIADKNRVFAYELTMLGTMIALVHLCFFFTTTLLAGLVIDIIRLDVHFGNILNRCIVILLISLSTWIFWS